MPKLPEKLADIVDMLKAAERDERIALLIDMAKGFKEVPAGVATRPFGEEHKVPHCESEAYVWSRERPDGALDYFFAVENPQGISAKATAALLDKSCSGAPLDQVAAIPQDVIYDIFGRELSMGKNMGLTAMLGMVQREARKRIVAQT